MDVDFKPAHLSQAPESDHHSVYIAGKMRGLEDWGRRHFCEVEDMLIGQGYIVLNPAVLPVGLPSDKYLPICLAMLEAADSIFMLSGWESSDGARIEYAYAICQGKRVIFEDERYTSDTMPKVALAYPWQAWDAFAERNSFYGSKEDDIKADSRTKGASGNT